MSRQYGNRHTIRIGIKIIIKNVSVYCTTDVVCFISNMCLINQPLISITCGFTLNYY